MENPNSSLADLIKEQYRKGVIIVSKLAIGTKLEVKTANSVYQIEIIDPKNQKLRIQGGSQFVKVTDAELIGSTWGGSALWADRIGRDMYMELFARGIALSTLPVERVVIKGDKWEYRMEW